MAASDQAFPRAQSASENRFEGGHRRIVSAFLSIASAQLLVRIMGMGMQVIVTARLGAGPDMDAYFIAVSVPTIVAQIAVGALQGATIPVYVRVKREANPEASSTFFSNVLNLTLYLAILVTIFLLLFRHQTVTLSAPAAGAHRLDLAMSLANITYPAMILTVGLGLVESFLNVEGQYGWPAYAGACVPAATALAVLLGAHSLGVASLAFGTLVGLGVQSLAFIVRARRAGLRYRPVFDARSPAVRAVAMAAWPLLLATSVTSINPLIDQIFASPLSAGTISSLNYALKLYGVPAGLIVGAMGRAVMPFLSYHAAQSDTTSFKTALRTYCWGVVAVAGLASIAMIVLAQPIVQILFERGKFSAAEAHQTAHILIGFGVGLTPMALGNFLAYACNSMRRTGIVLLTAIPTLTVNVVLDYAFSLLWGGFGIALATSVVFVINTILYIILLRRKIGPLHLWPTVADLARVGRAVRAIASH